MAREWSRRSIEEIARKIGKGLGGRCPHVEIGRWTSNPSYGDFLPYVYEGVKAETHYPRILLPMNSADKPSFGSEDLVLMGPLPGLTFITSPDYGDAQVYNTASFYPFTNNNGVIRDSSVYDVVLACNNSAGAPLTVVTNFSDYSDGELDIYLVPMVAEERTASAQYDVRISSMQTIITYQGLTFSGSELSNVWDDVSAYANVYLTIAEKVV